MNSIFVYCETENGTVADVSLELCTKGRKLADRLQCPLEALVIGSGLTGIEQQIIPYGVDTLWIADSPELEPYTTQAHTEITVKLFEEQRPQIALLGATSIGRDLGPRVSSALHSGLTADCTALEIGSHEDKKAGHTYTDLLYQIRPAFGGNIIATIINPDCRPQMATVREGVMKKEIRNQDYRGQVKMIDPARYLTPAARAVRVIERHIEKSRTNIKSAPILVSGGYGMGSREGFDLLFELAATIGAEVAASRAAVDAGFADHERQVGQTGVTVRPKLYIACGISGQVQHAAGMQESAMIISVNNDPEAPINAIADFVIIGDVFDTVQKMIKYYKENKK